jgi:FAD/FMN-containing dehydrogenase
MWAVRGAGANFGIITRLTYKAVRLPSVLAGTVTFPAASARDVLSLADTLPAALPDELSIFTSVVVPPAGEVHVQMSVCWVGDSASGRGVIAQLLTGRVPALEQSLGETTLARFVGRDNPGGEMSCARFGIVRRPLPDRAFEVLLDRGWAPAAVRLVFLDPLHGAVTRASSSASSFPRNPGGAGVGFILAWNDAGETNAMRSAADEAWGALEPAMSGTYVNMLDEEGEARVREAYGANYARLQHLKARYDPDNVFRSNQNIAPARSTVSPPTRL